MFAFSDNDNNVETKFIVIMLYTERGMDYGGEMAADIMYGINGSAPTRIRVNLGEAPIMVNSVKVS